MNFEVEKNKYLNKLIIRLFLKKLFKKVKIQKNINPLT